MTLLFLGLLCASIHWLVARSTIAKPLWSRATGRLDELLRCPACSGWWLGLLLGLAGLRPFVLHYAWTSIIFTGVLATILTPVFEAVLLWGLERTVMEEREDGSTREDDAIEPFDFCHAVDAIMRQLPVDRPDLPPDEIERFRETIHRAFGWRKD